MKTTVIHARVISGKYYFTIAGEDYIDPQDAMVFEITGEGEHVAPRSAPTPATREEMDAWIERLREAGYRVAMRANRMLSERQTA